VDDCQWLDRASAQALAFAARRIQAEGLRDRDARALLRSVVPWPLDEQIRERIPPDPDPASGCARFSSTGTASC
jgi:hypothetical protein